MLSYGVQYHLNQVLTNLRLYLQIMKYIPIKMRRIMTFRLNPRFWDWGLTIATLLTRPFYPMFLAIMNLLAGQEFVNAMWLQALLFGIFPAMVYLICADSISRAWGVATSLAIGLWGSNTILANSVINTANPKQMMTDFFLAIIISVLLYVTLLWFKGGSHEMEYAFIMGSALALSVYVRYSALILLPIWVILLIIKYRHRVKTGVISGSLISLVS